jgi:hypothetical protein
MATTNIAYAADTAITLTAWSTSLANGDFAYSQVVDNSTNLYVDAYVGGDIAFSTAVGGPIVAGDTMDIYVVGQYSDTATDLTGAIDALADWDTEEAEDTAFVKANCKLMVSLSPQATTPDTTQDLHFGPIGVAQFFGGILPKKWGLLLHNNTAATLGSGSTVNYVGITYTTA